jgi:GntR family transcriptional regulator/MocR family aminotransferase
MPCQAEDVAVFSQSQNALNLLVRLLTNPGDSVVVEEPGFGGIRNIAEAFGLKLLPVPVDADGININALKVNEEKISLIYVTPAHHDPTGSVMSLPRRQALLRFAEQHKAWIIEDDYDSNFNHAKRAQPALKALEPEGNVIYLSTFWKLLYPLSAVGFCVLPKSLRTVFARSKALSEPYSNSLEHLALVEMLNDGYLERHIRKVQKIYSSRRRALIAAMKSNFGSFVQIPTESGAMHYLVRFTGWLASPEAELVIAQAAKDAGLSLLSSKYAYMADAHVGEFIVDFASTDEETMAKSIHQFAQSVQSMMANFAD